ARWSRLSKPKSSPAFPPSTAITCSPRSKPSGAEKRDSPSFLSVCGPRCENRDCPSSPPLARGPAPSYTYWRIGYWERTRERSGRASGAEGMGGDRPDRRGGLRGEIPPLDRGPGSVLARGGVAHRLDPPVHPGQGNQLPRSRL